MGIQTGRTHRKTAKDSQLIGWMGKVGRRGTLRQIFFQYRKKKKQKNLRQYNLDIMRPGVQKRLDEVNLMCPARIISTNLE